MGSRLKQETADYMTANPGVKYTKARQEVLARAVSSREVDLSRAIGIVPIVRPNLRVGNPIQTTPVEGEPLSGDIIVTPENTVWIALGDGKVISDDGSTRRGLDEIGEHSSVFRLKSSEPSRDLFVHPETSALVEHLYGASKVPTPAAITRMWAANELTSAWNVPIGRVDGKDEVVTLNIADYFVGGSSPHGLVLGDAPWNNAHIVNHILLSLTLQYSPDKMKLAFIENTEKGCGDLSISRNLEAWTLFRGDVQDDSTTEKLYAEVSRRKRVIREAGVTSHREYLSKRILNPDLSPIPSLFVVLDGVFLTNSPDELNGELSEAVKALHALHGAYGVHMIVVGTTQRSDTHYLRASTYAIANSRAKGLCEKYNIHGSDVEDIDAGKVYVRADRLETPVKVEMFRQPVDTTLSAIVSAVNAAREKWNNR